MPQPLLSVHQVQKRFCASLKRSMWYGIADITADLLGRDSVKLQLRRDEFFALNGVSFDVQRGESVALIGRNGAGKSTLLKMVNGLFPPDGGSISVRGRVAALIELGAGFNPVLTGRENIYVNAAVLGMKKRDVDRQLDEIIDFAELEAFIDMPLKSYSSGMKVRLGFAVASQLEPDLLLLDEVLAVGDAAFRAKCHRRLSKLMENGTAFLLVSHNHHTLLTTCSRGIVLSKGAMIVDDDIHAAVQAHERLMTDMDGPDGLGFRSQERATHTGLRIDDVYFRDEHGQLVSEPRTGYGSQLCIRVLSDRRFDDVALAVIVRESMQGSRPTLALTSGQDGVWQSVARGTSEFRLAFPSTPFAPGRYVAKISLTKRPMYMLDALDAFKFGVDVGLPTGDSQFYCDRLWHVEQLNPVLKEN